MRVYLDNEYRCHLENGGGMQAYDTEAFDGKCRAYIELYRLVPEGETWERADGAEFTGEMLAPLVDYRILEQVQRDFEHEQYLDAVAALEAIYGGET